jgi:hypothetical protein
MTTVDGERAEIRQILAENIRQLDARIGAARDEEFDATDEKLQLKRLRTLGALSRQYRLLAKDADIDELEAEVDLLQEAAELVEDRS